MKENLQARPWPWEITLITGPDLSWPLPGPSHQSGNRRHRLEGVDEDCPKFSKGRNHCGGHQFQERIQREHAAIALLNMGAGRWCRIPVKDFLPATPSIWAFRCWCARVSEERWRAARTWKSI